MYLISDSFDFDQMIISKKNCKSVSRNLNEQLYKKVIFLMTEQEIYI